MLSPLEILNRKRNLMTHHLRTLPILILMPHSSCNCRCVMCDIWKANQNKRDISVTELEKHLDAFRRLHVRWVTLSGGEALLHRNLWTFCELLKTLDIKITLLSTGLLLPKHAEAVVRWCDEVIVSLDGSRQVHDQIRNIPKAYDKLKAGVSALRDVQPNYRVTGRCVLQRLNFTDVPHIIEAARDLNLNQISFLAADVSSDAFNHAENLTVERVSDIALSPAEADQFEDILDETIARFAADFESGFIAESPAQLRRLGQYYRAINGSGTFPEVRCNAPWFSAVIEADGQVKPCFFHDSYGNLNEQPFDALLNSPNAIAFRKNLNVADNPTCQRCVCSLNLGLRTAVG